MGNVDVYLFQTPRPQKSKYSQWYQERIPQKASSYLMEKRFLEPSNLQMDGAIKVADVVGKPLVINNF